MQAVVISPLLFLALLLSICIFLRAQIPPPRRHAQRRRNLSLHSLRAGFPSLRRPRLAHARRTQLARGLLSVATHHPGVALAQDAADADAWASPSWSSSLSSHGCKRSSCTIRKSSPFRKRWIPWAVSRAGGKSRNTSMNCARSNTPTFSSPTPTRKPASSRSTCPASRSSTPSSTIRPPISTISGPATRTRIPSAHSGSPVNRLAAGCGT